jgi:predicted Zn-dependent protease
VSDPILKYYTELNLYRLAEYSQLKTKQLYPVLIDSPQINAFAAPGGVVGINLGLYLNADDVHEYSGVLAHELAHLSQRHFARGIEMQQRQTLPYLAAMLASIAIAATVGGDAGMAALTGTQAAAQENQMRFSRGREQEADRIGINTLAEAGMDPHAMARMFERMQRTYRFTRRPPEFLLTHPVTESRISDARGQASGFPIRDFGDSENYQLMRTRIRIHYAESPNQAVAMFRDYVERTEGADWAYYGLALALARAGRGEESLDTAKPLFAKNDGELIYTATKAELLILARRSEEAVDLLSRELTINPDNKPLSMFYAEALNELKRFDEAEAVLERQSDLYPNDQDIWYELAETAGLSGNIIEVHQARAEYFQLVGNYRSALDHLHYARQLADPENRHLTAKLDQRIRDFEGVLRQMRRG